MMLFNHRYEVGVFKCLGDNQELVIEVGQKEYTLTLSDDEMADVEQHLVNQENLLIPFDKKSKQLMLNTDPTYEEEDMEELMNISEGGDVHGQK
ncbi:hypothetical protein MUO14_12990 [Halobacillus shinanisalinarum]|uniref:Uncharacterized protein n=1 Tax=Halobacillus shinanisalinarum TaxID=2932258 RepID=A0ABY4GUD0_9BACI|nr:hypothetical protein [Halobacillus shinanisalinarum]UOQ91500.1 hypothetical protein MUO14_12990 [Halobacillus shinanisalinarum]